MSRMAQPSNLSEACDLRPDVQCSLTDATPCLSCSHTVFKIFFEDSVQWAAPVCNDSSDWPYELRAAKSFQHIKQRHPGVRLLMSSVKPSILFFTPNGSMVEHWRFGTLTFRCLDAKDFSRTSQIFFSSYGLVPLRRPRRKRLRILLGLPKS